MTDRQRKMIEGYLPTPRDPELDECDYYVLDMADRVQRVHIVNIGYSGKHAIHQVITDRGHLVHGPYEEMPDLLGGGWYRMAALYDNKPDCRASEHSMYDDWEQLRELQRKEASQ